MFINKQLHFSFRHLIVFVFAGLAWISALNSHYPDISYKNLDIPFIWAFEVLFLSNCIRNVKQLQLLIALLFLCLFKISFFGAKVWISRGFGFAGWGIQGPPGYFQNSGELSLLMAITAVMSIPFLTTLSPKRHYLLILPITATMTVLGASSRGGQLALAIGLLYFLVVYKKIRFKYIIYLGITCWLAITMLPEEQKTRFMSMGDDETSISRINYWEAGIDMIREYPLTGVGYESFPEFYDDNYKHYSNSYTSNRKEVAHNSLIQVGSTMGIPALLLYLIFHFSVYYNIPKSSIKLLNSNSITLGIHHSLRAGILTYFTGAFFMSVAFYPYIYLLLSLAIALNQATKINITSYKQNQDRQ